MFHYMNFTSSYVVCTFPAMILCLNDKTDFFFSSASVPEWCYIICFVLVVVPFSTNPLIYVVSNQNYRRLRQNHHSLLLTFSYSRAYTETLNCFKIWNYNSKATKYSNSSSISPDPFEAPERQNVIHLSVLWLSNSMLFVLLYSRLNKGFYFFIC